MIFNFFIKTLLLIFSAQSAEMIRVRLKTIEPKQIELKAEELVLQGDHYKKISLTEERAQVELLNIFGHQWKLDRNDQSRFIIAPSLGIFGRNLRVNQSRTPEKIMLSPNEHGKVDVIAIMNLESYLEGVLPHEMPASWPVEALKAQTIAARSYAAAQMKNRSDKSYHVDSTIVDQVYRYDSLPESYIEKIKKVVRETKGLVLKSSNNKIVKSYYHADCGGQTETPDQVWNTGESGVSVKDSGCGLNLSQVWELSLTPAQIEMKTGIKNLTNVRVYSRTPSGRIHQVELGTENNKSVIPINEFREKLGFNQLKSAFFDIYFEKNQITFKGRGHGHGVGLCQTGSYTLAKLGKNFKDILSHYFTNTHLGNL